MTRPALRLELRLELDDIEVYCPGCEDWVLRDGTTLCTGCGEHLCADHAAAHVCEPARRVVG